MTVNLLSKITLFSDLPLNELERLLVTLDVKEMNDRDILFREGDIGEYFYIVIKGELEVLMAEGQAEELLLNIMREGEHFGEMSLILPGGHRTATVRARGPATLLSMSRARFLELTTEYPQLSTSMARVLSQRLDATNTQTFRDLTDKNKQLQTAYDELKGRAGAIDRKGTPRARTASCRRYSGEHPTRRIAQSGRI